MQELHRIMESIEHMRKKMLALATDKGMAHPDVLYASQMLDVEIVKYYKLAGKASLEKNGNSTSDAVAVA